MPFQCPLSNPFLDGYMKRPCLDTARPLRLGMARTKNQWQANRENRLERRENVVHRSAFSSTFASKGVGRNYGASEHVHYNERDLPR